MTKLTIEESKLVEKNHNLIYGFAQKYKLPIDDWYDVCAIGLIKAVKSYRSDDIEFSTFAYSCMFGEMRNELKYQERHWPETLSLDYEYENQKGSDYTLESFRVSPVHMESDIIDLHSANELLMFLDSCLKKDVYRKALRLLLDDNNVLQTSKKLGITRQSLEQQIDKLYKRYLSKYNPKYSNRVKKRKVKSGVAGS